MLKKEIVKEGKAEIIVVKNQEHSFSMKVIPAQGAFINSLVLNNTEVIDGAKGEDEILNNPAFKSTLLAPFPNRVKDGRYVFNGNNYQLNINEAPRNNALHGFIFNAPFTLMREEMGDDFAELELQYEYKGELSGYPFKFNSTVIYRLSVTDGFSSTLKFTNQEGQNIPFGFGWHPYFVFKKPVDDLFLKTAQLQHFSVDEQLIPTGKTSEMSDFVLGKSLKGVELDDCFLIEKTGNVVATELSDGSGAALKLWQETGEKKLNYLQIYIPPHRNSIAIEPQTCCIDAFNNKFGYFELEPGETISAAFGVQVSRE